MSSFIPPRQVEVDPNPYAAPRAEIGAAPPEFEQPDSTDEALRRKHLAHESRVRLIGAIGFAGMVLYGIYGVIAVVMGIVGAAMSVTGLRNHPDDLLIFLGIFGLGILVLALALACFLLARGLRRLQSWARWTWVVLLSLPIVGAIIGGVVYALNRIMGLIDAIPDAELLAILAVFGFSVVLPGSLLYLLLCQESRVIFTPEYRAVVARTPHIKYKMGRRTKWVAMLLVLAVVAALVIAALFVVE